jgi:hypothetical protein
MNIYQKENSMSKSSHRRGCECPIQSPAPFNRSEKLASLVMIPVASAKEEESKKEEPTLYVTPEGQLITEKPLEIHPALEFVFVVITVLLGVVFLPVILAVMLVIVLIKVAIKYPFVIAALIGLCGGIAVVVVVLNLFFGGSPQ